MVWLIRVFWLFVGAVWRCSVNTVKLPK
jgi:hypothetical protein